MMFAVLSRRPFVPVVLKSRMCVCNMSKVRIAILDDYQNVALQQADWSKLGKDIEIKVYNNAIYRSPAETIRDCKDFQVVSMMRERTPFTREVIERLPNLKLLITTGARNSSIDFAACAQRGIIICGTDSFGNPTIGIAFGLMLELTRRIGWENARMKAGEQWQLTLGMDLEGATLGIVGLGKLGGRVAAVAKAFGMKVIAWSQNLTPERCKEVGVEYVSKEDLFRQSDFVTIHTQLSQRTRSLVTSVELGWMKPTSYVINTSRGAIIDEKALIDALQTRRIAGTGLDVFDLEPLPVDHDLRKLNNVVLTPHLGYVSRQNYECYFNDIVENIRSWMDGKPIRVISP